MKCIKFQAELNFRGSSGPGSLVPGSTVFTYPFGTTLKLPTGMFSAIMSANLQSISNYSPPITSFSKLCRFTALSASIVHMYSSFLVDKKFQPLAGLVCIKESHPLVWHIH